MKDRLELYEAVNVCETVEQLCAALDNVSVVGLIQGRTRVFDAEDMKAGLIGYISGTHTIPNVITREFGLRQQAMYIKYYNELRIERGIAITIKPYELKKVKQNGQRSKD